MFISAQAHVVPVPVPCWSGRPRKLWPHGDLRCTFHGVDGPGDPSSSVRPAILLPAANLHRVYIDAGPCSPCPYCRAGRDNQANIGPHGISGVSPLAGRVSGGCHSPAPQPFIGAVLHRLYIWGSQSLFCPYCRVGRDETTNIWPHGGPALTSKSEAGCAGSPLHLACLALFNYPNAVFRVGCIKFALSD